MNDDRSPIDDEVLSAVLDGEATPEERALVEGSPEARRRLEQLQAAADRVAEPVTPLEPARVDELVARAVAEAPAPLADPWAAAAGAPEAVTEPARPGWRRFRGAGLAAAGLALAVLLVVAVAGLAGRSGREAADSSASGSATSQGADTADEAADAAVASGAAAAPIGVDLGPLPDAEAVLARFTALEASSPAFDHQFDEGAAERLTDGSASAATIAPVGPGACPVPPVEVHPGEAWSSVAVATLPTGAVVVMTGLSGTDAPRVLVVDVATCTVLAEGTG